jgi:hypothetical protein
VVHVIVLRLRESPVFDFLVQVLEQSPLFEKIFVFERHVFVDFEGANDVLFKGFKLCIQVIEDLVTKFDSFLNEYVALSHGIFSLTGFF